MDTCSLQNDQNIKKGPIFGCRHVQVLFLFTLTIVCYSLRSNLSIAIVAMTDPHASSNPDVPVYTWTNTGVILSSFFWSYLTPQVFAGYVIQRFGTKWFLSASMFFNGLAGCFIPLFADKFGTNGVVACRVIQGLGQGFMAPGVHGMLGKWAPRGERALMGVISYSGMQVGQLISIPIIGYLSASWLGWPSSFYIFGAISIIWSILWSLFAYNSPSEHPRISFAEKNYIESSIDTNLEDKAKRTPWLAIMTSLPFWAITISEFGYGWINITLLTQTPMYLHNVLKYDIESNGLLSITPNVSSMIMGYLFGISADYMVVSVKWPIGRVRRTFQGIGVIPIVIALAAIGFIPLSDRGFSVALLCISLGFLSVMTSTSIINHIDLSPRYAATLMGISNAVGNIPGIILPLVVQEVVTDLSDVTQWRTIFITSSGILGLTSLFYVVFASGERQSWD